MIEITEGENDISIEEKCDTKEKRNHHDKSSIRKYAYPSQLPCL